MNTLLNIGMRHSCDTVCQPNDGTCQDKDKKDNELPKDIIECPPGNLSHKMFLIQESQ